MPQYFKTDDFISKMVDRVRCSKDIGTCAGVLRILDARSGNGDSTKPDRFTLSFPYGGLYINWEVIFNINYPEQPPDFIFLDNSSFFNPAISKLKTLTIWRSTDEDALLNLLRELVEQFKQQQFSMLETSLLATELKDLLSYKKDYNSQLIAENQNCPLEVESYVGSLESNVENQIHVMTRIPILLQNPSNISTQDKEKILVLLTYGEATPNDPTCQVFPTPRLEKILATQNSISIAPLNRLPNMLEYVLHVTDNIKAFLEDMKVGVEKRRTYVESLVSSFSSHVIEYDNTNFHSVSLLCSIQKSHMLLNVEIPAGFPSKQPVLAFTSMMRFERGLVTKKIRDYPYSPRWSPQEMASRLRTFLEENLGNIEKSLHNLT